MKLSTAPIEVLVEITSLSTDEYVQIPIFIKSDDVRDDIYLNMRMIV